MKATLLTLALAAILAAPCPAMPDFTKGDTVAKGAPHEWTLGDLAIFLLSSPHARSTLGQRRGLLTLGLSWLIPTALVPFGGLRALSLSKRLAVNASCQPHD